MPIATKHGLWERVSTKERLVGRNRIEEKKKKLCNKVYSEMGSRKDRQTTVVSSHGENVTWQRGPPARALNVRLPN